MAKLRNVGERSFGAYGEAGYHRTTPEDYEQRRFRSSRRGQRKMQREAALVAQFLQKLPPGQLVLDAPCGMGRFTEQVLGAGHRPVGLDLNTGMLQRARERHGERSPLLQGDVLHLPFGDATFDAVICFRLLHHLPDNLVLAALAELRRVAGTALVTFYDTRCIKYRRKRLLGKRISGQYYPARHVKALAREAGWRRCRHMHPFAVHVNLHALRLGS